MMSGIFVLLLIGALAYKVDENQKLKEGGKA